MDIYIVQNAPCFTTVMYTFTFPRVSAAWIQAMLTSLLSPLLG